MSGIIPTNAIVRNPREAAKAFSSQPKQRNLFLVRFVPSGVQTGANPSLLTPISFIVKSTERPKVNTKTEELHQYNKKRVVFTGFKLEPVRIQFYDDAQSNALQMWQNYVQYYFGDFTGVIANSSSVRPYAYDVINAQMQSMNFGFTAAAANGLGDFYFDRIEIYHFYDQVYDVWQLINPRITAFDPDELDYSTPEVSLISMSVSYENLQFITNQPTSNGDVSGTPFSEFATGATFDGNVIPVTQIDPTMPTAIPSASPDSSSMPVSDLITSAQGSVAGGTADYRYISTPSTGPLGQFGDYQYGPTVPQSLASLALTNPALATALDMGSNTNPLAITQGSLLAVSNTLAQRGVNGTQLDIALSQANAATSGQGNATNLVTKAILASNAIRGTTGSFNDSGLIMSLQGYGAINAQQTGTSQYGFNANIAPDGSSSGYTGPNGYQGPVGQENDGPYDSNLPGGLYGRYGLTLDSLGPINLSDSDNSVAPAQ